VGCEQEAEAMWQGGRRRKKGELLSGALLLEPQEAVGVGGGNHGRQNSGGGEAVGTSKVATIRRPTRAVGRLCSDRAIDMRAPRGFIFFQFIQNYLKLVKSKWMPYRALKFPNFCMMLDSNVLNKFINCATSDSQQNLRLNS
jgi:hypothetical protein